MNKERAMAWFVLALLIYFATKGGIRIVCVTAHKDVAIGNNQKHGIEARYMHHKHT